MRKIVCRLRLNEVSRQWRRRPKLPPNASCSCISCSPTGCPPRGEVGRRPASGRSSRQGMSPPHGCGGRSHGSAARSRCWYGCGSNARWENRSRSAFPLYNFLGHSLLSPFRMVCGNFILPEPACYGLHPANPGKARCCRSEISHEGPHQEYPLHVEHLLFL